MHHASSDVIGSQGVESQSHHSMHDVYLQFPVYFTTILRSGRKSQDSHAPSR